VLDGFTERVTAILEIAELIEALVSRGEQHHVAVAREPGGSLIVGADASNIVRREAILRLVAQYKLPTLSVYRQFAEEGALMSYGPDSEEIFRQSASYVDRILKGEAPASLPAQAPTKFEFVINLKTARSLGLSVPANLLAISDRVIE